MTKKLLEFNIPDTLPEDYDPILGRSVGDVKSVISSDNNHNVDLPIGANTKSSVFDDPDLDFSYTPDADGGKIVAEYVDKEISTDDAILNNAPEKPNRPNLSEQDVAELLGNEANTSTEYNSTSQTNEHEIITDDILSEPLNFADEVKTPEQKEIENEDLLAAPIDDGLKPLDFTKENANDKEFSISGMIKGFFVKKSNDTKELSQIDNSKEPITEPISQVTEEITLDDTTTEINISELAKVTDLKDELIHDIAPEVQPFETFDGEANAAFYQAKQEGNLTDTLQFADEQKAIDEEVKTLDEITASQDNVTEEIITEYIPYSPLPDVVSPLSNYRDQHAAHIPEEEASFDELAVPDIAPEVQPFETFDGEANAAFYQAKQEDNLTDTLQFADEERAVEQATIEQTNNQITPFDTTIDEITDPEYPENKLSDNWRINDDVNLSNDTDNLSKTIIELQDEAISEPQYVADDNIAPPQDELENINSETIAPPEAISPVAVTTGNDDTIRQNEIVPVKKRKKRKKKKRSKLYDIALTGGIFFTGISLLLLLTSLASPLGAPFDAIASYGMYWMILALAGTIIWLSIKEWLVAIISAAIVFVYAFSILPWLGIPPKSGDGATKTIGWANVQNSPLALQNFISQADANEANLLVIAGANGLIAGDIQNWKAVQVPIANDDASLAILAKDEWRAVTLIGEPTITQPRDSKLTIIGVAPAKIPAKDNALINRAANRTGDIETPVLTIGDFGVVAWDRTLKDFIKTSNSSRVRCGGYFGTTYNNGLLGIATDHAFAHNMNIKACDIGKPLQKSKHKPLFVTIFTNQ